MGPLIDKDAVKMYLDAISNVKNEGGRVIVDGGVLTGSGYESGCYVKPVIVEAENSYKSVQRELAPILYLLKYSDLSEAMYLQNNVPQGLSSAIMTTNFERG